MKFLTALVFGLTFLVSCNRIEGQLNITKDLTIKNASGETKKLAIGTYTADFRESTFGKNIVLRLNNDTSERYKFRLPKGVKIPTNGTLKLTSAEIGQNVDLLATVKTDYMNSPVVEGYESCTYTENYTVCNPGPYGQMYCQTYTRVVPGSQWVRYYNKTTHQNFIVSIAEAGSVEESAQFLAQDSYSQRVILNQSLCR